MTPEDIANQLSEIDLRNKRVELDKAWETSWTRRLVISIITFLVALIWLYLIHESMPYLKAFVPVFGYILSTLSLSIIKTYWQNIK